MNSSYLEPEYDLVIGESAEFLEVGRLIQIAVGNTGSVLISGETGTGKDLIARYIHHHSNRSKKPYVPVNCGAIPKDLFESELFGHEIGAFTGAVNTTVGLFRSSDGGTIYLDEITEIPPETQVKLLRVLQDGKIRPIGSTEEFVLDVQVIAATNRDLKRVLRQRSLREDLYYRLGVIRIEIPPLRKHPGDIPELVNHLIRRLNGRLQKNIRGVSPDVMEQLLRYSWPGNVRQLENVIENAYLFSEDDWITQLGPSLEEEPQIIIRSTGEIRAIHSPQDPDQGYFPPSAMSPDLNRKIRNAAKSPAGVLILGEEGTGSQAIGREIHNHSANSNGSFVIVYCESIQEDRFERELFGNPVFEATEEEDFDGYFRQAEGGTLFFHEVTAIPYRIQMLLFQMFTKSVFRPTGYASDIPKDIRIIAYTALDPDRALRERTLAAPFYARLSSFSIFLSTVREQKDRIPRFVNDFVEFYCSSNQRPVPQVNEEARTCLSNYSWPGNFLELRYVMQGAASASDFNTIQKHHLPDKVGAFWHIDGQAGKQGKLHEVEWALLDEALQKTDGNKTQAARLLGISRKKLYRMIESSGQNPQSRVIPSP